MKRAELAGGLRMAASVQLMLAARHALHLSFEPGAKQLPVEMHHGSD